MAKTPKVLFVTYSFPPTGGVSVHRVTKFVKYLPEYGWNCSVLTVSNPSVPLVDDSLLKDIPESTTIVTAKTLEPSYKLKQLFSGAKSKAPTLANQQASHSAKPRLIDRLKKLARTTINNWLVPDMQVLWNRNAVKAGLKLLQAEPHDAIVVTAPPFSSFLVGVELAKQTGLPLILDYRDEWDISNAYWENKQQNSHALKQQAKLQNEILKVADHLVATTPSSTAAVADLAKAVGSKAGATCIYNGYDADDFPPAPTTRKDYGNGTEKYRVSYVGTLWNLNSVEPLVQAVEALHAQSPALCEQLELVFAGRRTGAQDEILKRLEPLNCHLVRLPFVSHDEAVEMMQTADGLVLLNSNLPNANRIVSGKCFEYIAAEKTIYIVSPKGDMWELLADCPFAFPCPPDQPLEMTKHLALELERHRLGAQPLTGDWEPKQHERRNRAQQLAEVLNQVTDRQPSHAQPQEAVTCS